MAFGSGNSATWSDMTRIYNRVRSEQARWGQSQTTIPTAAAGTTIAASHGSTLQSALQTLTNNVSFLSGFRTNASTISSGVLIKALTGSSITSTDPIENLRARLNGMRTTYGVFCSSHKAGTFFSSFTTGNNFTNVIDSTVKNTNSYTGSGFYFYGAWSFFYNGDTGFTHTQSNSPKQTQTTFSSFCTGGFLSCGPFCTAGFCTSYFTEAL